MDGKHAAAAVPATTGRSSGSARQGRSTRVEIDTNHFKGNYPESASLDGCFAPGAPLDALHGTPWREILPRTKLRAASPAFLRTALAGAPVSHVRLNIFPDGGVSRSACPWNRRRRLDSAPRRGGPRLLLTACCGSSRWVERMLGAPALRQPRGAAGRRARGVVRARRRRLARSVRAPPEDRRSRMRFATRFAATRHLSEREQAGIAGAPDEILEALAEGNRAYEEKFGFIFIVCATGRSARRDARPASAPGSRTIRRRRS